MSWRDVADDQQVEQVLALLGVVPGVPDRTMLCRLQRAWMFAQPFHNIDLLAGYGHSSPALDRRQAWARCVQGLGGPCHVQASSFLVLIQALGFEAHFAAAEISHPGDHLVVCVWIDRHAFISDVGNGHPYLAPFPLDGESEQTHLGWRIRTRAADGKVRVEQRTPQSDTWRRVYVATPEQRCWSDFKVSIRSHHTQADFGPFLTGLRATRIREQYAFTLRDDVLVHYTSSERHIRTLNREHEQVLMGEFGLGELPIHDAVRTWRHNSGRL